MMDPRQRRPAGSDPRQHGGGKLTMRDYIKANRDRLTEEIVRRGGGGGGNITFWKGNKECSFKTSREIELHIRNVKPMFDAAVAAGVEMGGPASCSS